MAEISVGASGASGSQAGPKPAAAAPAVAKSRDEVRGQADQARGQERQGVNPEGEGLRAVSENTDTRLSMAPNTMATEVARQAVLEDVEALRAIDPAAGRTVAVQAMGQLAQQQEQYRAELERQDPAVAAEVEAAFKELRPAPARQAVARARDQVDLELELEAEVEREGERLTETSPGRKTGGVELGARPAAVARAAAIATAVGDGKSAADSARPGVVPTPATNKPGAQASAAAEEELDEELAEEDELLRRKRAAEAAQAAVAENAVDARPSGRELAREEIIIPRRIVQSYTEVDGKFFAKDSSRMMFEDKGLKLATSGTNKDTIADMVALARAKNWQNIKLTGAQEFRREAWLQAESQGVKTQGYTPKEADLAALKTLTQERSTNVITPVVERGRERPVTAAAAAAAAVGAGAGVEAKQPAQLAPRHDLNKNQAAMHVAAMQGVATNVQALREKPGSEGRSVEELTKLAYWRGIVQEESKDDPVRQREAVERFDAQTADPEFVKRITRETQGTINDKTVQRVQTRDTHEQSL